MMGMTIRAALALAVCIALTTGQAYSAKEEHPTDKEHAKEAGHTDHKEGDHADHGEGDHGHKELSYIEVIFPLTLEGLILFVWTLAVFLGLLFVMSRFAWKPMLEGLRRRELAILTAAEESKKARESADKLRAAFESERKERAQEITQIMEKARHEAEALRSELRAKANEEIEQERNSLRAEINKSRDQALLDIWAQTAQLTAAMTAKSMGRALSEGDRQQVEAVAKAHVEEFKQSRLSALQSADPGEGATT